jgi:hypothetical protein
VDRYQVQSTQLIDRYLTLLLFASKSFIYDGHGSLIVGLHRYRLQKKQDMIEYIYNQAQSGVTLAQIKTSLGELSAFSISKYLKFFWKIQL